MKKWAVLLSAVSMAFFCGHSAAAADTTLASLGGNYAGNLYTGTAADWESAFLTFTFDGAGNY
ncbi:MAG: hypothetical protein JRI97_10750, partial [Deltaproteobacteria bacterium]|nr:hypothetical protein [Deltaproteobacteria bacterium]